MGCNRKRAFEGEWTLDRAYTESKFKADGDTTETQVLNAYIGGIDGAILNINSEEIQIRDVDGSGTIKKYEIIETPTPDSWRIKTTDGRVETVSREGERLVISSDGGLQVKLYFRRSE